MNRSSSIGPPTGILRRRGRPEATEFDSPSRLIQRLRVAFSPNTQLKPRITTGRMPAGRHSLEGVTEWVRRHLQNKYDNEGVTSADQSSASSHPEASRSSELARATVVQGGQQDKPRPYHTKPRLVPELFANTTNDGDEDGEREHRLSDAVGG